MWYVYIHFKPNGRPFYVGKGLAARVRSKKRPHNSRHTRTLNKYGEAAILVWSKEFSTHEEAVKEEVRIIAELRSMGVDLVNFTDGGDGTPGFRMSKEQRAANGKRKIGNKYMLGRPLSSEARAKISLANTGKKRDAAFREMRRRAMIDYFSIPGNRERQSRVHTGKKHSEESRLKMSLKKKGMMWVTNEEKNRQIRKGDEIPEGWRYGRVKAFDPKGQKG